MGKKQVKNYTDEFRRSSAQLAYESNKSVSEVSRELGINATTLHGCVPRGRRRRGAAEGLPRTEEGPPRAEEGSPREEEGASRVVPGCFPGLSPDFPRTFPELFPDFPRTF